MKKCPNCGRLYADFVTNCSACNISLSNNQVSSQNNIQNLSINQRNLNSQRNSIVNTSEIQRSSVKSSSNQSENQNVSSVPNVDSGSWIWLLPGFFIPLVGWGLYFKWKISKPQTAKMANIGAWIGFVSGILLMNL